MKRALACALLALLAGAAMASGTAGAQAKVAPPAAERADDAAAEGRRLFTGGTTPPCAICHTLRAAEATGVVGPDLDALQPDAKRVANAVQRGFENMPAFGDALSAEQIETLARYVAESAGR